MRPSLLPGLLTAAQRNRNRGFADVALFEVGQAYRGDKPEDQFMLAGGVRVGTASLTGAGRHLGRRGASDADLFDVKADVSPLLAALGVDPHAGADHARRAAWFHPGRSGQPAARAQGRARALRRDAPRDAEGARCGGAAAAFEVFLDALPAEKRKSARPAAARCGRPAAA